MGGGGQQTPDALGAAAGLPEMLAQLPPTTDVAFIDGRLGRANPLLAEVEALEQVQVQVREFPMLRREALARWNLRTGPTQREHPSPRRPWRTCRS